MIEACACGHEAFRHRVVKDQAGEVLYLACPDCSCQVQPSAEDRAALAAVKRLLAGDVDDGANAPPFDVLLAHWPWVHPDPDRLKGLDGKAAAARAAEDAKVWLALRRRALTAAWAVMMPSTSPDQRRAITRALGEAAAPARRIRIEGRMIDRNRDVLKRSMAAKSSDLKTARKAYRDALKRLNPITTRAGVRFTSEGREAMGELGALMSEHPELTFTFPQDYCAPGHGIPLGPIVRRDTRTRSATGFQRDPLAYLKRQTVQGLSSAGLNGRKHTDTRALLLFSVGLIFAFDPKATARLLGGRIRSRDLKDQKVRGKRAPKSTRQVMVISGQGRPTLAPRAPEEAAVMFLAAVEHGLSFKK